ncbi:MAG: AAA family ATPase [Candidatus Moranbacteria bacterium]|nr:AAA family ATPase [Candidatus Moranbacteria bacterium]
MDQSSALKIMKQGNNVLLTGPAGSGKTYLLGKYIDYLKKNRVNYSVTATTGIAATHLNGITIHSWSGIGIKEKLNRESLKNLKTKYYLKKNITKTKVLIIDEISMLHPYQLVMLDKICRMFKKSLRPFGGIQLILCGDFFQLPPIKKNAQSTKLIFESSAWKKLKVKYCYLNTQYRQTDPELINILNKIRSQKIDNQIIQKFLKLKNAIKTQSNLPTRLYTHNLDVDSVNHRKLEKIQETTVSYTMYSQGNSTLIEILKRGCLAPEVLTLKKKAIVMFVKNDFEAGYVNGTLGKVIGFDKDNFPIVLTNSDKKITAFPKKWKLETNEDKEEQALIEQIPLRLAWAVTIHKSQGMTLDCASIDLGKCFEYGMGYVALSRVKNLKGINLLGFNQTSLKVNPYLLKFEKLFQKKSRQEEKILKQTSKTKIKSNQQTFLNEILEP